jgi:hypothetical protein
VIPSGFEPETYCLEGSCSIQLSYETICNKKWKFFNFHLSGWQDSNLRPPAPKAGAITGLRYTPKVLFYYAERQGFEPWHRLPDDRLAICSVTTPAPLLLKPILILRLQRYIYLLYLQMYLKYF